jgi:adenosylcobinamide-GDP ribazoletransferase
LLGHHQRERALEIMKDSRVGAMGLVAVSLGLAVKWGGIAGLEAGRALILVIVPSLARGGMLLAIRQLPYGRPEGGTGHALFAAGLPWHAFWGLGLPALLCLPLGWRGLWLLGGALVLSTAIVAFYRRRIGCVTGDMLGAMTEVLEAGLFLLASAGIS